MRYIDPQIISDVVAKAVRQINTDIDPLIMGCFKSGLSDGHDTETKVLDILIKNADIAKQQQLPLCQDTGLVVVFASVGIEVSMSEPLDVSIQRGVAKGYVEGFLRKSMVCDPLYDRQNTGDNTPAMVSIDSVVGDKLTLHIMAKGGGSENASALNMFTPSDDENAIIDWVVDRVRQKGPNACPPLIIGLGLGGSFDVCALLAKKSLGRLIGQRNADEKYALLERKIFKALNELNLGAGGYGGHMTVMDVFIETAPCHIASLPVALNIGCHSTRHTTITL